MNPLRAWLGAWLTLTAVAGAMPARRGPASPGFVENCGQVPGPVEFVAYRRDAVVLLEQSGLTIVDAATEERASLRLVTSHPMGPVEGRGPLPGVSNYYLGNQAGSWTRSRHWAEVRYASLLPQVDLVVRDSPDALFELVFELSPGSDPALIEMELQGSSLPVLEEKGIRLEMASGALIVQPPRAYEVGAVTSREVAVEYDRRGPDRIGLRLAVPVPAQGVIVDPVVKFATYYGGSGGEGANAFAVDACGNSYVTSETSSLDLTLLGPSRPFAGGASDVYVASFDALGQLVFATYLGGGGLGTEGGQAIAVDPAGGVFVGGFTNATDFPLLNALQAVKRSSNDGFVARLDPISPLKKSESIDSRSNFGRFSIVDRS